MELDNDTQTSFLQSIYRVSDQMLTLVDNLLDVAVIESGRFDLKFTKENISRLTGERIELMAKNAERKEIRLIADLQEVTDSLFDADRMRQVVDNLLSNAIKFSPLGSVVNVACGQAGRILDITVTDHGLGIPSEDIDKLFGAFEKLSARPTGGEKSTGLGLSIVKSIVDAHGGEIEVDSKVGKGTTFIVHLPVEPAN